jgi:hypothetical protein
MGIYGSDYFKVEDLNDNLVDAKYLRNLDGSYILQSSGKPYIVPADFDLKSWKEHFSKMAYQEGEDPVYRRSFIYGNFLAGFISEGKYDIQTTYNGTSGSFVRAFRPAASYVFGVACREAGLTSDECIAPGGIYNKIKSVVKPKLNLDTSGRWWNSHSGGIKNDENIMAGYEGKRFPASESQKKWTRVPPSAETLKEACEKGVWVVQPGNVIGDIERACGVSKKEMADANKIPKKNITRDANGEIKDIKIFPGQRIKLPEKADLDAAHGDIEAAKAEAIALQWLGDKLGKTVDETKDWLSEVLEPAKAGASELSPSKADKQSGFDRSNEQDGEYTNVRAKEIFGTLYETWQPCKEGYIDREQEKKKLIYDMPTKTYEQTWNRLLDQRLTPEERNAYDARKELQKKRDYLENYYLDFKSRGEKKGYYRFYSQHLPEFMKSEGQKKHEMEKADLFRQHDELKGREEANLAACESREAKQNDPEFKNAVDRTYAEMMTDKQTKSERIKVLDGEMGILRQRMIKMSKLSKYLPESIGNKGILIKGDPKDIDNVLAQSREVRAQTAHAVLEKQPDYNFETGRPHEQQNEYRQQIQRTM